MMSLKDASIELLGVTAVVNAMKNHPKEAAIQEKACSALTAMASADGEREVSFAASGAISAIVCTMQAHVSDATSKRRLVVHYKVLLPRVGQNVPQSWQV